MSENKTNKYLVIQDEFKSKLLKLLNDIFQKYNNSFELKIEDVNLLEKSTNCIESSTAIGYLLEEFISSKLITSNFKNKLLENEIYIQRENNKGTQNSSYDFFSEYQKHLFLVNIKTTQGSNNAVASINQLYLDYVEKNIEKEKHFLILKILYSIKNAKICISGIESYFLEEIDFTNGYRADSRNWSENFNQNSARLMISKKFLEDNRLSNKLISHNRTKNQLIQIYNGTILKIKK